jgi:hypothetical protein
LADPRFSDLIISFLTAALNPQTSSHWEPRVCFLGRTCYLVISLGSRRMRITSTANWPSLSGRPQDMWTDLIKFHVVHGFLADIDLSSHGSLCPLLGRTRYWAINITLFASTVHRPPLLGRLQKTDLIFFFCQLLGRLFGSAFTLKLRRFVSASWENHESHFHGK